MSMSFLASCSSGAQKRVNTFAEGFSSSLVAASSNKNIVISLIVAGALAFAIAPISTLGCGSLAIKGIGTFLWVTGIAIAIIFKSATEPAAGTTRRESEDHKMVALIREAPVAVTLVPQKKRKQKKKGSAAVTPIGCGTPQQRKHQGTIGQQRETDSYLAGQITSATPLHKERIIQETRRIKDPSLLSAKRWDVQGDGWKRQ